MAIFLFQKKVSRMWTHPEYNPFTRAYDLALIELEREPEWGRYARPACLPLEDEEDPVRVGDVGVTTGWGKTEDGGANTVLRKVNVTYS